MRWKCVAEFDYLVRCKKGVSLDDITSSDIVAYDKTHQIAKYAEEAGFSTILAPSARDTSGTNIVVFGGF